MKRKMTLIPLIAATYSIVAGGPFGLEDIVSRAGYVGAISILLLTPLFWGLPTALVVSELASAIPAEGGYYAWLRRALGPFWGFQEAWLTLTGSIFDMAIYPILFVAYLGHFSPALTAGRRGILIGMGLIALAAAWNMLGAKLVAGSSIWLGILLLAPFAVLAGYGFLHPAPAATAGPHLDFLGGILVAMWNYMGWDNASTVANEVERPQRTYPLAMAATLAIVTLTYILPIIAVAITGLPASRWSTGGWADVARAVTGGSAFGAALAVAIGIGGMLGAVDTLNSLTMTLSRLPAVMADDGYLPKIFTWRNAKTCAPWVAILGCATAWALCLNLSFAKLIMLDVLLTGLSILLEFVALVALRIREPNMPRPYRVPGGLFGAIAIGIPPAVLLILAVFRNEAEPVGPINALEFGAILIAAGFAAYYASRRNPNRKIT
jgi:amino acid transporter